MLCKALAERLKQDSKPQTSKAEIEDKHQSPTGFYLDITHVKEIYGKSEKQRLNIFSSDTILQIFCKPCKNGAFSSQYVRLCHLVLHCFFFFSSKSDQLFLSSLFWSGITVF